MIRLGLLDGAARFEPLARRFSRVEVRAGNLDTLLEGPCEAFVLEGVPPAALLATGKPLLALGLFDQAESAVEACLAGLAGSGARVMFGGSSRFLPAVRVVKECLDSGRLGEPGLLRIHRWEFAGQANRDALLLLREIDLACWLFGKEPDALHATGNPPDYLQLHLGFPGGGMALLDHARTLPSRQGYYSLSLIGSSGAAHADDHHDRQILLAGDLPEAVATPAEGAEREELGEFLGRIERGEELAPETGVVGRAVELARKGARIARAAIQR